jgi:molybdopterin-guanine dinucleotide biosynthesis protein B
MDREGKDSWRHKQAGASTVVLSSGKKIAMIKDLSRERTLDEIRLRYISGADLILTEGYKRSPFPKVEVSLFNPEQELLCGEEDQLIAVVSPRSFSVDVPVFGEEEIDGLADLLVKRFLRKKGKSSAQVFVGGRPMPLNSFVQETLWKIVRAFLSSLKGWDPAGPVEIRLAGEAPGEASPRDYGSDYETGTGNGHGQD